MLTGEQVRLSIQLLDGACLMTSSETKRLAQTLGSREELVAWLFLTQGYASRNAPLRRVLETLARSVATPAKSNRSDKDMAVHPECARRAAETALKAILQSDNSHGDLAGDAMLRLTDITPSTFHGHSNEVARER